MTDFDRWNYFLAWAKSKGIDSQQELSELLGLGPRAIAQAISDGRKKGEFPKTYKGLMDFASAVCDFEKDNNIVIQ